MAVVTADADSFTGPIAVGNAAEGDDGAGNKLPGRVHAGGCVDDALAEGQWNADRVEELELDARRDGLPVFGAGGPPMRWRRA